MNLTFTQELFLLISYFDSTCISGKNGTPILSAPRERKLVATKTRRTTSPLGGRN